MYLLKFYNPSTRIPLPYKNDDGDIEVKYSRPTSAAVDPVVEEWITRWSFDSKSDVEAFIKDTQAMFKDRIYGSLRSHLYRVEVQS
tara:strand:+ start:205 stop:462 length:258 start_codon:yes stop_codon:yes gene_type:complete